MSLEPFVGFFVTQLQSEIDFFDNSFVLILETDFFSKFRCVNSQTNNLSSKTV